MKNSSILFVIITLLGEIIIGCTSHSTSEKSGNNLNNPTQIKVERFTEMTPEEIRAHEIKVMREIADLELIPPKLNTSPLPEFDYNQLDYGMNMSIEITPKGRLYSLWTAGADGPDAFLVMAYSDNEGETWSKPILIINNHSKNLPRKRSNLCGVLWTDCQKRLWVFFTQEMDANGSRGGVWASFSENPDDKSPTWSKPQFIWFGMVLNKPIMLSSGEWLLTIHLAEHILGHGPYHNIFPELDSLRGVNTFISKDKGASFERRGNTLKFPDPDWHEPMVIEKKDSSLWMLVRTKNGIAECTSKNHGKTWSIPSNSVIKHPNSRFHLRRLASGRLLLVKHGETIDSYKKETHRGRNLLTVWLSNDDGYSWEGGLVIDERNGISYPDATQSSTGTIFISYDRDRNNLGEILMARVTEEDILSGKIVTPDSRLKMLINRPLIKSDN